LNEEKWLNLLRLIERLRGEGGCPWDREQTHESLKRNLLEESYEVLDAIDERRDDKLCDELGDVLLQVVFHAQIAKEEGRFDINDVLEAVTSKMIRRHPHVFAGGPARDSRQVLNQWELIKAGEGEGPQPLMKVNDNLPALLLAQKVQDKAARVGFDWPDIEGPLQKLEEELYELKNAPDEETRREELGDLLFSVVNAARFLHIDAEDALRASAKKFIRRFGYIERELVGRGGRLGEAGMEVLSQLWKEAKEKEKGG